MARFDDGTNFASAEKELQEDIKRLDSERMGQLSDEGVQWHFKPPSSRISEVRWNASFSLLKEHLK